MYCEHCGVKMPDDAVVCTNCGCEVPDIKSGGVVYPQKNRATTNKTNSTIVETVYNVFYYVSIISFAFAFFWIIAYVCRMSMSFSVIKDVVSFLYDTKPLAYLCGLLSPIASIVHFILSFNEKNKSSQKTSILVLLLSIVVAITVI